MTVTTEKLEASKKLARDYIDQVFKIGRASCRERV